MTYFGFLFQFLVIPILLLSGLIIVDRLRDKETGSTWRNWPAWAAILLHVFIAVIYTTPWDNYLVATRVWWYDPALVTGLVLGWVPIEEYTFFVLQPILGGLWILFLQARLIPLNTIPSFRFSLRRLTVLVAGLVWLGAIGIFITNWRPGTYLALELVWALPPIALQLGFGADILWRYRRLVFLSIVPLTLYLSFADAVAIDQGTWTINPEQSLNIFLGGVLPVEEFLFFVLTNTLITFGLVLILAQESLIRIRRIQQSRSVLQFSTLLGK